MSNENLNHKASRGAHSEVRNEGAGIRGTVRIAPAVLIELIELTVQDIDGVAGLRNRRQKLARPTELGAKSFDNGKIAVTVNGDQIDAAIAFAIQRGANVSALSTEVQKRIGFAVGNMLGMTVRTVDISIEEIISGPAEA
jgi:uncharacterized alkaline shock family protein YloU